MDSTCIFICELTEYFISAKMFVFKKTSGVFLVSIVDGLLHFKWGVHVGFFSFWAIFSSNTSCIFNFEQLESLQLC